MTPATENRRFLRRAVRYLLDAGIRQFVDIGCGMPTRVNVHDIVHGVDLDLAAGPGYSFETTDTLLRLFDENVATLRATLSAARDADFDGTWRVRAGDTLGLLTASSGPPFRVHRDPT